MNGFWNTWDPFYCHRKTGYLEEKKLTPISCCIVSAIKISISNARLFRIPFAGSGITPILIMNP
jgi:hypothetical protein